MSQKQQTFHVGREKITIKSRPKSTRSAAGWTVNINGTNYHCNLLTRKEAEDHAYGRWVKETTKENQPITIPEAYRRHPDAEPIIEDEELITLFPESDSESVTAEVRLKVTLGDFEFYHHGWHEIKVEKGVMKGTEVE